MIGLCSVCWNITEDDPCRICSDPQRDYSLIMVVQTPQDLRAMERRGSYGGVYHVLHGAISPVRVVGPDDLKIRELLKRVVAGDVQEVIIATNPGMEGDATAMYIQRELRPMGVKISRQTGGFPPDLGPGAIIWQRPRL
jgi:recombination protein RecR